MSTTPLKVFPFLISAIAFPFGSSLVPTALCPLLITFVDIRTKSSPSFTKKVAVPLPYLLSGLPVNSYY